MMVFPFQGAGVDSSVAAESKPEENENGGAMVPMKTHDEVGAGELNPAYFPLFIRAHVTSSQMASS